MASGRAWKAWPWLPLALLAACSAVPVTPSHKASASPEPSPTPTPTTTPTGTPGPTPTATGTPVPTPTATLAPAATAAAEPSPTPPASPTPIPQPTANSYTVSTYLKDGLDHAANLVFDAQGTMVIADYSNHCLKKRNADGTLSVFAGQEGFPSDEGSLLAFDGVGGTGYFKWPRQLAYGPDGMLYVADQDDHAVRRVAPDGTVSTVAGHANADGSHLNGKAGHADGTGTAASFDHPNGVAVQADGHALFVADTGNHTIRRVSLPDGAVTTVAGAAATPGFADGPGATARFRAPEGLAFDHAGNLYVADGGNHRVRVIAPDGTVSTLVGTSAGGWADGPATVAVLHTPSGLAFDAAGNLYVSDSDDLRIRWIDLGQASHPVATFAGHGVAGDVDGPAIAAQFGEPRGLAFDAAGSLYVADEQNSLIRRIAR